MAMMKQPSMALTMLALVVLAAATGNAQASCDPSQLLVCLPAITTGAEPAPECCANLTAQQGCFCQYAKDPNYGKYINSPYALKTLASCHLPIPHC